MTKIMRGQTVDFYCVSFLADGTCLDDEENLETLHMKAGEKNSNLFYSSIAQSLIGMTTDQTRSFQIPFTSAFGKHDQNKIYKVPRESQKEYQIGDSLNHRISKKGRTYNVKGSISHIFEEHIELDTNHPLAGENIHVKIKIKEIHH